VPEEGRKGRLGCPTSLPLDTTAPMDIVLQSLQAEWTRLLEITPRLALALLVFLLFSLVGRLVGRGVDGLLVRSTIPSRERALARRASSVLVGLFGLLVALHVLGLTGVATSLLATGGLAAVVLGFAFREIGENFLAGLFLAFDRSFGVGDLVESEGLRGVARAVALRHVHIRTAHGCDIFIPSSQIFKNPLQNYTRDGLRRTEFTLGADYAHDPEEVLDILRRTVNATRGVLLDPPAKAVIGDFAGGWVEYTVTLWVEVGTRRALGAADDLGAVRTACLTACHRALREREVVFSSEVSTSVALHPVDVALTRAPA